MHLVKFDLLSGGLVWINPEQVALVVPGKTAGTSRIFTTIDQGESRGLHVKVDCDTVVAWLTMETGS